MVEQLYQKLSEVGLKPWMDKKDIIPGEKWEPNIHRAIGKSDFFLACLSTNSICKRGFLQKEIKRALDIWQEKLENDIYLIPVRLEECEVPESLSKFQWVDLFEENGWARLMRSIEVGMQRRGEEIKTDSSLTKPSINSNMTIPQNRSEQLAESLAVHVVDMLEVQEEFRNGLWAYEACKMSREILEDVLERCPQPNYVEEEIIPLMSKLEKSVRSLKLKSEDPFSKHIESFAKNIEWRIFGLEKYILKKLHL